MIPTSDSFGRKISAERILVVSLPPCDACMARQLKLPESRRLKLPVLLVYPNDLATARKHLPVHDDHYRIVVGVSSGMLPAVMHAWAPQAVILDRNRHVTHAASGPGAVQSLFEEIER